MTQIARTETILQAIERTADQLVEVSRFGGSMLLNELAKTDGGNRKELKSWPQMEADCLRAQVGALKTRLENEE